MFGEPTRQLVGRLRGQMQAELAATKQDVLCRDGPLLATQVLDLLHVQPGQHLRARSRIELAVPSNRSVHVPYARE